MLFVQFKVRMRFLEISRIILVFVNFWPSHNLRRRLWTETVWVVLHQTVQVLYVTFPGIIHSQNITKFCVSGSCFAKCCSSNSRFEWDFVVSLEISRIILVFVNFWPYHNLQRRLWTQNCLDRIASHCSSNICYISWHYPLPKILRNFVKYCSQARLIFRQIHVFKRYFVVSLEISRRMPVFVNYYIVF